MVLAILIFLAWYQRCEIEGLVKPYLVLCIIFAIGRVVIIKLNFWQNLLLNGLIWILSPHLLSPERKMYQFKKIIT